MAKKLSDREYQKFENAIENNLRKSISEAVNKNVEESIEKKAVDIMFYPIYDSVVDGRSVPLEVALSKEFNA